MRKGLKIALIVLASVAGLLIAVSLLAPPIAKSYVNHHGEELIGRRIELGHLGLNLLSGHLALHNLTVYEDDGETAFAGFDTLDVKARLLKLISREVDIRHLLLSGLNANVIQNGSEFNFNSMLDHFKSDDEDDDDTVASKPWTLRFNDIKVLHAKALYADLQRGKEWNIRNLNLIVPGFVIGSQAKSEAGLTLALADGGSVKLNAHHNSESNDFTASVVVDGFALSNIKEYLTPTLNISDLRGSANIVAKAIGNLNEPLQSNISGLVTVSDVALQTPDNKNIAELKKLVLDINQVNIANKKIDVNELSIDGLCGLFERYDDHTNFSTLIAQSKSEPNEEKEPQTDTLSASDSKPADIHVANLALTNCYFTYIDHTLPDPFEFPVSKIRLEAKDLSLAGHNNARLFATLPGGGHAMLRWEGDLNEWKQSQNLFLSIKGLDLKQFSPWLVAYMGTPFTDGIFGFTSHNTIRNSNLNGKNKIDIYKAQVGSPRLDVTPKMRLPLKSALYILKDKDDKILLDVPVKGNIDNPEFNYMKLVWKTLQNLLVKVATSPARAIGGALGISDKDMDFMAIDPKQHGFTSEQYHQLGALAQIATYDTSVVLTFELQAPTTANDSETRRHSMLNEALRHYMIEQGVAGSQIVVTTKELDNCPATGYAISSAIRSDEPLELPGGL
ncbi:MAG: DUF748 domain-containing protein [Bacteroidales bacterium]|nr:DUF748 domain-containing protein [Bacteroidales bacterium]